MKGAINYNEHKVKEGTAELLMAKGYSKIESQLTMGDKVNRLQRLADLNTRVVTHCLHVSLNFDVGENLDKEKLQKIVNEYMDTIGFGKQPFLVYEHRDAAHQHVHIVTTNIQRDGKRISLHNLGRVQSEKARKEIEIQFNLVKAGDKNRLLEPLRAVRPEKAIYGKTEVKRAISNVVSAVVTQYQFASLTELNAVLKQYNVMADRGAENTRMFAKKGLQYCLLDGSGNKIGVPIKASNIYGKPTLANLEYKYETNKQTRQVYKHALREKIDQALGKMDSKESFKKILKNKGVDVLFRKNEEGFLYGITYIDHQTKSVFNGSELGKGYSAAAIRGDIQTEKRLTESAYTKVAGNQPDRIEFINTNGKGKTKQEGLFDILINPSGAYGYLPYELRKKRKRKTRRP